MNYNKLILFVLFLPFFLALVVVLFPIILVIGLLALLFGQPVTVKAFRNWNNMSAGNGSQKEEDVIDVEVIHSGNSGEENGASDRHILGQ